MDINKIISKKDFENIKLLLRPLVFVPMAIDFDTDYIYNYH